MSLGDVFRAPGANHTALKPFAYSQYPRCGQGAAALEDNADCINVAACNFTTMGYSVRDGGWRLTSWKVWDGAALQPVWAETVAIELYDHRADADGRNFSAWENTNQANSTQHAPVVQRLAAALARQFQPT